MGRCHRRPQSPKTPPLRGGSPTLIVRLPFIAVFVVAEGGHTTITNYPPPTCQLSRTPRTRRDPNRVPDEVDGGGGQGACGRESSERGSPGKGRLGHPALDICPPPQLWVFLEGPESPSEYTRRGGRLWLR